MSIATIELSQEQQVAVDRLVKLSKPVQTLGGYAGTGKTTVIKELKRRLPGFAVCAYTGKATSVLQSKGILDARTIHSLIYVAVEEEYYEEDDEFKENKKVRVYFVPKSKEAVLEECNGFLIDEASMIGSAIHTNVLSYGLPVIYVGDHGQLPPVADGNPKLMENPDIRLETLHRNAGEIAEFAQHLRQGYHTDFWESSDKVEISHNLTGTSQYLEELLKVDQVIVAYNRTRVELNKRLREALGYPSDSLVVGDRLMCLKNCKELGLFNGMQITVLEIRGRSFIFQTNGAEVRVDYDPRALNCENHQELLRNRLWGLPFDYCYAVTCHKAQGSEWDNVAVIEQRCSAWDHRRWAYTAASRAKEYLLWIC